MVFSSTGFLFIFLPLVLATYFIVQREYRNLWLLVVSLFFYAWGEGTFTGLLLLSIVVNYGFGRWVESARRPRTAQIAIGLVLLIDLGILGWFKYANFLFANLNRLAPALGLELHPMNPVHLPIGISFFTFHAISYVIDIHRGRVRAEKNPLNVALYITLFPQLIAGPIIRYHDIADQIVSRMVTREGFAEGVRRFIYGMGKKVLIANRLAVPTDQIFALPTQNLSSGLAWLGALCYTLQIYFDFSGYSDMAIGLGHMFGFKFPENFRYPYVARSMSDFWQRWHISLSTWFRDYLYIPLGGNRCRPWRNYLNLLSVYFLCGLWHGASWNFLAWGLYHGTFLIIERQWRGHQRLAVWLTPFRQLYVVLVFMVGQVIFRTASLHQALAFLRAMAGHAGNAPQLDALQMFHDPKLLAVMAVGIIASAPLVPWLDARREALMARGRGESGAWVTETLLGLAHLALLMLILGASARLLATRAPNPFIYFQF